MLKACAIIFGIIMLIIGTLGFIPEASPNNHLFGIFHVNLEYNLIHLATGIISLACGLASESASRVFFQIFGIIYGLVALLGFYYGDRPILGGVASNLADTLLHILISIISLYLGFVYHPRSRIDSDYPKSNRR